MTVTIPQFVQATTAAMVFAYLALAPGLAQSESQGASVPVAGPPPREKPDASRPRSLTYDSRACSRDAEGMVYFAIHRRVFRQPLQNLNYILGREPEYMRLLPLPPKPGEPEGCPDHPIQADVFHLSRMSAILGDPAAPPSSGADSIRLVINGGTSPMTQNRAFDVFCERFPVRDNSIPGWLGCSRPTYPTHTAYLATEYLAPEGRKMSLFCRAGVTDIQPVVCNGGYRLQENLVVNLFFSQKDLPISEFIVADQELRRRFDAAEVKNYPWATAPADNDTGALDLNDTLGSVVGGSGHCRTTIYDRRRYFISLNIGDN